MPFLPLYAPSTPAALFALTPLSPPSPCHATGLQEEVGGVSYDRLTRVACDTDQLAFDRDTVLTSVTFDGPSHTNWWYWVLTCNRNGTSGPEHACNDALHMFERAYTHHTWFLYMQADDGASHFPTAGSYRESRCPGSKWPP